MHAILLIAYANNIGRLYAKAIQVQEGALQAGFELF